MAGGVVSEIANSSAPLREATARFRNPRSITAWIEGLLVCTMVVAAVAFFSDFARVQFVEDIRDGVYTSRAEAVRVGSLLDGITRSVSVIHMIVFLLTAILFLSWVYRANCNARALGAVGMETNPGWAVGWYFVPLANLVMPFLAMKEIWNASAFRDDWKQLGAPPVVCWWWGLFLAYNLSGQISGFTAFGAKGLSALMTSGRLSMLFDALCVIASVPALLVVHRVTVIQVERFGRSTEEKSPS